MQSAARVICVLLSMHFCFAWKASHFLLMQHFNAFFFDVNLSNQPFPYKTWNRGSENLLIWAMLRKPRNQNSVILIQIVTTIIDGLKRIRTYHWIKNVFKFSLFRVLGTVNNKNINYNINTVSVLAKHFTRNKRKGCKFCNCCCLQIFY